MKNKKSLISTILMCLGLTLAVVSIFCFFGDAINVKQTQEGVTFAAYFKNVFTFMFGGLMTGFAVVSGSGTSETIEFDPTHIGATPILTVLFVFEIIAITLAIIAIVGAATKKISFKRISAMLCAISGLMLVGAVLGIASKNGMLNTLEDAGGEGIAQMKEYVHLGSGIIAYVVLAFISVASNVAGLIVSKISK